MELRLAREQDLPQLYGMYREIIEEMNREGIAIWDDFYPCGLFAGDIAHERLYVLEEDNRVLGAFALCQSDPGESSVQWPEAGKQAMFLDRFGVNVNFRNRGIGSRALALAADLAANCGAEVLRLFVVDINRPAVALYEKNGFSRAEGIYHLHINENTTLREFGYEKRIRRCL